MVPHNYNELNKEIKNLVENLNFKPSDSDWEKISEKISNQTSKTPINYTKLVAFSSVAIALTFFSIYSFLKPKSNYTPVNITQNLNAPISGEPKTNITLVKNTVQHKRSSKFQETNLLVAEPGSTNNNKVKQTAEKEKVDSNSITSTETFDLTKSIIESAPKIACVSEVVSWKSEFSTEEISFLWNFGDGSFSKDPNPEHIYSRPGKYTVTLSTKEKNSPNILSKKVTSEIEIIEKPTVEIKHIKLSNGNIKFNASYKSATANYKWIVNGKLISTENEFLLNRNSATKKLEIQLEIIDNNICINNQKLILN